MLFVSTYPLKVGSCNSLDFFSQFKISNLNWYGIRPFLTKISLKSLLYLFTYNFQLAKSTKNKQTLCLNNCETIPNFNKNYMEIFKIRNFHPQRIFNR